MKCTTDFQLSCAHILHFRMAMIRKGYQASFSDLSSHDIETMLSLLCHMGLYYKDKSIYRFIQSILAINKKAVNMYEDIYDETLLRFYVGVFGGYKTSYKATFEIEGRRITVTVLKRHRNPFRAVQVAYKKAIEQAFSSPFH